MFITIKYSCDKCGIVKRDVVVPSRQEGEDIEHYIRITVAECIQLDHQDVSKGCNATSIKDLMIPYSDKGVGFK